MNKLFTFKPIETRYNGYHFRSRLEARWALFFDTLGISYEYEKEGYDLEGTWYLPDFWLPEKQCWVEIKGENPTEEEIRKAKLLALYTGYEVYIFSGNISMPDQENQPEITCYCPPTFCLYTKQHEMREREVSPVVLSILNSLIEVDLCPKVIDNCLQIQSMPCEGIRFLDDFICSLQDQYYLLQHLAPSLREYEDELIKALTKEEGWYIDFQTSFVLDELGISECPECHYILFSKDGANHSCSETSLTKNDTPRLIEADTAARSARF